MGSSNCLFDWRAACLPVCLSLELTVCLEVPVCLEMHDCLTGEVPVYLAGAVCLEVTISLELPVCLIGEVPVCPAGSYFLSGATLYLYICLSGATCLSVVVFDTYHTCVKSSLKLICSSL